MTVDGIEQLLAVDPSGSPLQLQTTVVDGPWLKVGLTPEREGNYWVGLSTKPRKIPLSGSEFTEYLKHDGIRNVLKERKEKGISDRDEVERYSKYVKAYLQVGNTLSSNHSVPLGLEIEIIPLENPYSIGPGDTLPVQALFQGEPLGGLTLHAGFEGQPEESVHVLTDKNGKAGIRISEPGRWKLGTGTNIVRKVL